MIVWQSPEEDSQTSGARSTTLLLYPHQHAIDFQRTSSLIMFQLVRHSTPAYHIRSTTRALVIPQPIRRSRMRLLSSSFPLLSKNSLSGLWRRQISAKAKAQPRIRHKARLVPLTHSYFSPLFQVSPTIAL